MSEPDDRTLLAAQGYCELGMFDDALGEIGTMPPDAQRNPKSIEMRVHIFMRAKRWQLALEESHELCAQLPAHPMGFIHASFCLHEMGRTAEARELLLGGPDTLHTEPTYHYNLACYECRLGQLDLARAHLEKSFAIDRKFRHHARLDPDLEALRA